MTRGRSILSAIMALLFTATYPVNAQPAPKGWTPPRTAWGDPDLRGTWPLDAVGRTPMQRPPNFGTRAMLTEEEYAAAVKDAQRLAAEPERENKANKLGSGNWFERGWPLRQTSLIVEPANGRVPPMTELGKRRAAAMKSSWSSQTFDTLADFNSLDRCITRGMPASMVPFPYNNGVRIFQAPGYVVLQLELVHETRIIPLDRRARLPGTMETWLGSSRGHFEGNTLVIESGNFNGEAPMVIVGPTNQPVPTSKKLHIVERLTPTGPDTIQYEALIEDPETLTTPFKMAFPWTRNDKYELFEYACHEGNIQLRGFITSTSPRFAKQREAAFKAIAGK
ncbi:MAG: hypothetical protein J7494_00090 [Sphingobium sp.]|nr:hypothetical protein [Sphingobium sp.]